MKRLSVKSIASRFAALTFACLIGCVATYVFNRVYVRFDRVAMGSLRMESRGRGGISLYRASDGVNLSFAHLDFPSAREATKAFEKVVGGSTRIISGEFVRDREAESIVGERLVALFLSDDGREWPMMVRRDGDKFYQIWSTSVRHILIFEKEHCRY